MRVAVPCFGQLRFRSLATSASLGLLFACGSSGDGGLFGKGQGGAPASTGGVAVSGGAVGASGGSVSVNGGQSAAGGVSAGGPASGGNVVGGGGATGGGISSGGTPATGGTATVAGTTATGGAATTGGAVTLTGGQGGKSTGGASSGGTPGAGGDGDSAGSGGTGSGCAPNAVERCDGLDNDCNGMVDEKACPAKCTGFDLDGHGYMVCDVEVNANRASALCEEQGLRLAWIESATENAALLESISDLDSGRGGGIPEVSIGATDSQDEGDWHWRGGADFWQGGSKGMPVDGAYVNWAQGRPNNSTSGSAQGGEDCAVLVIDQPDDGDPGEWNDVECTLPCGVLCEEP